MKWEFVVIFLVLLISPKAATALLNFIVIFILIYLFFPEFLTGLLLKLQG